jgi:nifR3 family TIM-barrel protein
MAIDEQLPILLAVAQNSAQKPRSPFPSKSQFGRIEFMTNATSNLIQHPRPIQTRTNPTTVTGPLPILKIGQVPIGFPVVQAALSGYSDGPMRVIARRLGASYTVAEVMIDRFVLDLKQRHRTRRHLRVTDEEHPVGGQLMGSDPASFGPAAQKLVEVGFDVIDINFGCPVKSTAGSCRGGYLLSEPEVAMEIVSRTREAVPSEIPVTLKMRRGLDDSAKSLDDFYRILDGAFARGVAAITVHGRTVQQKYIGPSNWDFLFDVKKHAGSRTILGSGDLFTAEACLEMLRATGVDGVSVARGAIGNPWIFSQARALAEGLPLPQPSIAEQRRVMELQFQLCLQSSELAQTLATMRTFGIKFAQQQSQTEETRNAFTRIQTIEDWQAVLDRWYPIDECTTGNR